MYLLDTDVISEMRKIKSGKADAHVAAWLAVQNPQDFYTNAVVAMEIERGILSKARKDPIQGEHLRLWQQAFFANFVRPRFADYRPNRPNLRQTAYP